MTAKRRSKVNGAVKATTNHDDIVGWAEEKGARPAVVRSTGLIRLHFPGFSGDDELEPIAWDEFFEKFEEARLALLYQNRGGAGRNFNKLVHRETAAEYGVPLAEREPRGARAREKSTAQRASGEPKSRRKAATTSRRASGRSSSRSATAARGAQRSRPKATRTTRVRSAGTRPRATAPKQVSRKSLAKKRRRATGKTRSR